MSLLNLLASFLIWYLIAISVIFSDGLYTSLCSYQSEHEAETQNMSEYALSYVGGLSLIVFLSLVDRNFILVLHRSSLATVASQSTVYFYRL